MLLGSVWESVTWICIGYTINILPDILRGKGNHTMKFDQIIEYNMRNIFLKNHTQNLVAKLVPDLKKEIKIEHISGPVSNFTKIVFIAYPDCGLPKHIEAKVLITCFYFL